MNQEDSTKQVLVENVHQIQINTWLLCDTKDVIKMVPVVPLFSTEHSKGKILALSQELR